MLLCSHVYQCDCGRCQLVIHLANHVSDISYYTEPFQPSLEEVNY